MNWEKFTVNNTYSSWGRPVGIGMIRVYLASGDLIRGFPYVISTLTATAGLGDFVDQGPGSPQNIERYGEGAALSDVLHVE